MMTAHQSRTHQRASKSRGGGGAGRFLCMPLNRSLIVAHELGQAGLCKSRHMGIIVGWQATYGRPNILAVPIAGYLTPRQGRNIQSSILEVSAVRFARPRSTRGPAIMIFSIGKSIRRSRLSLAKGGGDQQASQAPA